MNAITAENPTTTWQVTAGTHVHLVGIGGSGLSAIAQVLLEMGCLVSGSDQVASPTTAQLQAAGATVFQGHRAANVAGAALVLVSSAVPASNVEWQAAQAAGIPVLKRAEFLGALMAGRKGVAVAGTHGKTTTTGMIAHILLQAGQDPTVVVGGVLPALGGNGHAGRGPLFVVEADEYDRMFLGLRPTLAVIGNIEHDHPDIFASPEAYRAAFADFARLLPPGGLLVAGTDDAGVRQLLAEGEPPGVDLVSFGLEAKHLRGQAVQALDMRPNQLGGTDFLVQAGDDTLGIARLRVPGLHNVRNALAAVAVARWAGLGFRQIVPALGTFAGMGRRFERLGEAAGVTVIDDYAHHPTEIQATLAAARQQFPGQRLWAVWQPHTYSRTRLLQPAFAASFADADQVIVLEVYRSREWETLGVDLAELVAQIRRPPARFVPRREDAARLLLAELRPGDVLLTLGAGDGREIGFWVLEGLHDRSVLE